jgi:nucleoside-diphosphate-sugar epimerase
MDLGTTALLGAGGAVGHALVPTLRAHRVTTRVIGRDTAKLDREFPAIEARRADFLTGEGLGEALSGVDTIFYLAGAPYTHFEQHPVMTGHALAAARRSGVKRFVHIAPIYSYGLPVTRPIAETQPRIPNTRKGRWRLEQEELVEAAHGEGGMSSTIAYLPDFYGPNAENSFVNVFLRDAVAGKTATFVGVPDALREFIYVPDAAAPLLALAEREDAYGQRWNIPGTVATARKMVKISSDALGDLKFRYGPKVVLQAMGVFNPMMREIADTYYLKASGIVLNGRKLHDRVGPFPPTPLDEGVAATIAWIRTHPTRVAPGTVPATRTYRPSASA